MGATKCRYDVRVTTLLRLFGKFLQRLIGDFVSSVTFSTGFTVATPLVAFQSVPRPRPGKKIQVERRLFTVS